MQCKSCKNTDSRVLKSRSAGGGLLVKRTRECLNCSENYITYEFELSFLINPLEMKKFYDNISGKEITLNKSPSKTEKLERKEFNKLINSNYYWNSINLNKLYGHLNIQETIIINMRFIEEATTEEVVSWVGISKEKVRSAELKALKFLRAL